MTRLSNTAALILLGLLASPPAGAAEAPVPKLNLTATCRAMDGNDFSIKVDTQRCLKTEDEARATLVADWAKYNAADRNLCSQTARIGGMESYVQLLTCLEMQRDVAVARSQPSQRGDAAAPLLNDRPVGLRRQPVPR
jgi:hypothetical protein